MQIEMICDHSASVDEFQIGGGYNEITVILFAPSLIEFMKTSTNLFIVLKLVCDRVKDKSNLVLNFT